MSSAAGIVDDVKAFTPQWLTKVLVRAGITCEVTNVSSESVGAGQMASCYRLHLTYGVGTGPTRLIAKLPLIDDGAHDGRLLTYRTEVGFYKNLASRVGINVPKCYFADISEDATSFNLLLSDLAPAKPGDQIAGCTTGMARAAAQAVAGLHAQTWCDSRLEDLDFLIPATSTSAQQTAVFMPQLATAFIDRNRLPASAAATLHQFASRFADWALARPRPFSLVHNDFRLDNLLFGESEAGISVTAVDWQTVSIGQPTRDLAFLLGTGLPSDQRRLDERAIVTLYHQTLTSQGVAGYGLAECWDDYRFGLFHGLYICMAADAVAKTSERGARMFSMMAERAATAIADNDAFETF